MSPANKPHFKPTVAQPKTAQNVRHPSAPPVYRPQPTPKVLQTKGSPTQRPQSNDVLRRPSAPPVYRPEAKKISTPAVYRSQPKAAHTQPTVQRSQPQVNAPPNRLAQMKPKALAQPKSQARPLRQGPPRFKGSSQSKVVQAMFTGLFGSKKGKEKEDRPGRSTYDNGTIGNRLAVLGYTLEATEGKFRIVGTNILIDKLLVNQCSPEVFGKILILLSGNSFVAYRAVSRYHPRFFDALAGKATPLGTGKASFDTGSAAWTAWQWNIGLAESIAASSKGMGEKDHIELQPDYTRDDAYEVGVILETTVTPGTEVCFFNATEMQIKGQVNAGVHRVIHMGTRLENIDALSHYSRGNTTKVAHLMPPTTPKQQDAVWRRRQKEHMVGMNLIKAGESIKPLHDYSSQYIS